MDTHDSASDQPPAGPWRPSPERTVSPRAGAVRGLRRLPRCGARHWRHTTTYVLPARSPVHATIYTFDSQAGLRNPIIAQATGRTVVTLCSTAKQPRRSTPAPRRASSRSRKLGLSVPLSGSLEQRQEAMRCSLKNDHTTTYRVVRLENERPGPASTAGSASPLAPRATSKASAARCRPSLLAV